MDRPLVTVVIPVYNQKFAYLDEAVNSVLSQSRADWRLVLADNHSEDALWAKQKSHFIDPRITLLRHERNLGVFGNLNAVLPTIRTSHVLFLCSDDRLKIDAIDRLLRTLLEVPEADLVLPSFDGIDESGALLSSGHDAHRRAMIDKTRALGGLEALELLLRFGSFNGNLTGTFFPTSFFAETGPFRSDWRHAADWDWLCRAATAGTIVLSLDKVAEVRSHKDQLSNANVLSGHQVREVSEVLRTLLARPELALHPRAQSWARHHMQYFLWNALRAMARGDLARARQIAFEMRRTTGVLPVLAAFIGWIPRRLSVRLFDGPPLVPPP
jgi:hypothetical protein